MKNFLLLLNKKLTVGLFLSTVFTCIFALVFKFFWLSYGILSVEYILSGEYISYLAILSLFRFIFGVLLEFLLGDKFFIPIGNTVKISDIALMMEDKSKDASSKQGSGSSKQGSGYSNESKPLAESEKFDLEGFMKIFNSMEKNLDNQDKMIKRLAAMKEEKKVQFSSENGDLSIYVPPKMPIEEAKKIADEVGVIDRLLNTYIDEYKELSKKDSDTYDNANNMLYQFPAKKTKDSYKELFEED